MLQWEIRGNDFCEKISAQSFACLVAVINTGFSRDSDIFTAYFE